MGGEATELTYLVKSGTTPLPKVSVPVVVVDVKRGEGNVVVTVQGVAGVPVKQILEGGCRIHHTCKAIGTLEVTTSRPVPIIISAIYPSYAIKCPSYVVDWFTLRIQTNAQSTCT